MKLKDRNGGDEVIKQMGGWCFLTSGIHVWILKTHRTNAPVWKMTAVFSLFLPPRFYYGFLQDGAGDCWLNSGERFSWPFTGLKLWMIWLDWHDALYHMMAYMLPWTPQLIRENQLHLQNSAIFSFQASEMLWAAVAVSWLTNLTVLNRRIIENLHFICIKEVTCRDTDRHRSLARYLPLA